MTNIVDLYGLSTQQNDVDWQSILSAERCPFLERQCVKARKSQPNLSMGTCSVRHGDQSVVICPHRLLERHQIFLDCLHLLTFHEPGNELHLLKEIAIPGGSVDYVVVSVRRERVVDFVGIELQAVDTTGSVWEQRQQFLRSLGMDVPEVKAKSYGMNWKMTAKTTLVQLHHKVETFEHVGKHLVLALQDDLMTYMRREFNFGHIESPKLGDAMHFHTYTLERRDKHNHLVLVERFSTNTEGVARSLGLQGSPNVDLGVLLDALQGKISSETRLRV